MAKSSGHIVMVVLAFVAITVILPAKALEAVKLGNVPSSYNSCRMTVAEVTCR